MTTKKGDKSGKKKKKSEGSGPFEALRALKAELQKKEEAARAAPAATVERGAAPRPVGPPTRDARQPPLGGPPNAEDDAILFHRLFAGVQPLDRPPGRLPLQTVERSPEAQRASQRSDETAKAETDAVHAQLRSLVEGGSRFEVEDDGTRVEGRRVDLPLDALRRLRRGLLPIDARMDLHGLGVQQSRAQLEAFLKATRARGERCVLVIHGKGEHSPGGSGVLRGEIAAWLSQGAASVHVAAFATACSSDGGEGAVYVLLRR